MDLVDLIYGLNGITEENFDPKDFKCFKLLICEQELNYHALDEKKN
ncbi:hypothetical protein LCGC14_0454140 [marine sediment metagenome]|uniref:Uncharacterized protein n=1 Tax=marine sediment metagenome TaxID=412755 RepID=A0A0F9SM56_9ZZZZ